MRRDTADIEVSKVVRNRDGCCVVCGNTETLQCCHIYGRRAKILRYSLDNLVTMCAHHHRYYTENPVAFIDFLHCHLGDGHMNLLRERARGIMKTTKAVRSEIAKHYREELKKMEADPEYSPVSYN